MSGSDRPQWSIARMMALVALVAVALGMIRAGRGHIVSIVVGSLVAAILAPRMAYREVRQLDDSLVAAGRPVPRSTGHILLLALWGLFRWGAWFVVGFSIAVLGALASLACSD